MRKLLLSMLLMTAFIQVYADDVMRKEKDGTYVVNTTTLADDVKGYIEIHQKEQNRQGGSAEESGDTKV